MNEFVQSTNDDATFSKAYAVSKNYWKDPFVCGMLSGPMTSRAPEINRGYWARVVSTQALIENMLNIYKGNLQVVNLGAGFCTMYMRISDEAAIPLPKVWIDVDLPQTIARKVRYLVTRKFLLRRLVTVRETSTRKSGSSREDDGGEGEVEEEEEVESNTEVQHNRNELHAPPYHALSADLLNLNSVKEKLSPLLDFNQPTLFLSECVLVYLPCASSAALLRWISDSFSLALYVSYEQVNMSDRFGHVMLENLRNRQGDLPGVDACLSLESQKQRFVENGWLQALAWDMNTVYNSLPKSEIRRVERLEMLDEREVMQQLFSHYCLVFALSRLRSTTASVEQQSAGDSNSKSIFTLDSFNLSRVFESSVLTSSR